MNRLGKLLKPWFLAWLLLCTGPVLASNVKPVAWVLYANGGQFTPYRSKVHKPLPTLSVLRFGDRIVLKRGEVASIVVFGDHTRREFEGPAHLRVIKDTVSLRQGERLKVFPLSMDQINLAERWVKMHPNGVAAFPKPPGEGKLQFDVERPLDNALILSRQPEFHLTGVLPRDAKLIIYDSKNRRFWIQPLEDTLIQFPPAASFQWGERYSWEIRKLTGGTLLKGKFRIATEKEAFDLLSTKVPDLPDTPKADLAFYAVKLQLAGAWKEAKEAWSKVGK